MWRCRLRLGDRVLIENPDLRRPWISSISWECAIGLDLDEEGITVDSLRAGITHQPIAL